MHIRLSTRRGEWSTMRAIKLRRLSSRHAWMHTMQSRCSHTHTHIALSTPRGVWSVMRTMQSRRWHTPHSWRRAAHEQSSVRCSRAACRILGVGSCVITHACDVVVAPVTFWRRAAQEQSWRLSHCWCRDRRVYCRIAVQHFMSKYRPSVPRSMGGVILTQC